MVAAAQPQKEQCFLPIAELSNYQTKWTICARVTQRTETRTFNKGGSSGKVFSVELLDEHGGEIRASFFGEAVDLYSDKVQKGKCYTFTRGSIKIANRQFTMCKHRYELTFDKLAEVKEVDDISAIEAFRLNVTPLRAVQSKSLPCTVDICGVITAFTPALTFTSQAGRSLVKREITIADDSAIGLAVTIWGDRAQQDDKHFEGNPTVGLKGVLVKEWQTGRSGSLLEGGALQFLPQIQEAQRILKWWQQGGSKQTISQLSAARDGTGAGRAAPSGKATDLAGMRRAAESATAQPEFYTVVSRLSYVQMKKKDETMPLVYMACQEPKEGNNLPCNRRVDSQSFCASCNRAGRVAPRFNLRAKFSDFADNAWITTFHEGAKGLLGMPAEKARELDLGDEAVKEATLRERYFLGPLQVTVRVRMGSYNNEPRPDISCVDARPVSRGEHGRSMLKEIREMIALTA